MAGLDTVVRRNRDGWSVWYVWAWSVRCPGCETIAAFLSDEVGCWGCDQKFELAYDHRDGEVEGVILV